MRLAKRLMRPSISSPSLLAQALQGTCQLLNGYDLIGAFDSFKPKFAKRYGNIAEVATNAFECYAEDVRSGRFPDADHTYTMNADEAARLAEALKQDAAPH